MGLPPRILILLAGLAGAAAAIERLYRSHLREWVLT